MIRTSPSGRWQRREQELRSGSRRFVARAAALIALLSAPLATAGETRPPADPIAQELGLQSALFAKISGNDQQSIAAAEMLDEEATAAYLRGLLLLERGELEAAIPLLESAAQDADDADPVRIHLAAALLHAGQARKAQALLEPYLAAEPADTQAIYLDGIASAMQGDQETADRRFRHVGMRVTAADQVLAASYQVPSAGSPARFGTADQIAGRPLSSPPSEIGSPRATAPQRFHFTFLTGLEYDSNVPLAPQFQGLGAVSEREDARSIVASFADWQVFAGEFVNVGLIASTFNTFQFEQDRFNLQDYMGGAYTNAILTDDVVGGMRYEYHSTLLDGEHLASEHRLTPNVSWMGSQGHTTLYYEYNPISSSAPALIPEQRQSADIHGLGVTQAIYTFGGDGRLYFGYRFETAEAEGSDFDRDTHMATARIERPLPMGWIGDAELRHFWSDYDHPNSLDFHQRARSDRRWETRLGLQRNFLDTAWSLRFDYTYIGNDSNVENLFGVRFYEYDRHVLSSQLIYSF